MAVIAIGSATGSPGVTTTTLGLALNWPRPVVLVEADPAGTAAVMAGWGRGNLQMTTSGLLGLVMPARNNTLAEALPDALMSLTDNVSFLPGIYSHTQATSLPTVWEPLIEALADLHMTGQDVIIDAGRLGHVGSAAPLLLKADIGLLMTRSSLPSVLGTFSWANELREQAITLGASSKIGLAIVDPGHPFKPREISKTLGLPVRFTFPLDHTTAEVYSHGAMPRNSPEGSVLAKVPLGKRGSSFESSALNKALLGAASRLAAAATAHHFEFESEATTHE